MFEITLNADIVLSRCTKKKCVKPHATIRFHVNISFPVKKYWINIIQYVRPARPLLHTLESLFFNNNKKRNTRTIIYCTGHTHEDEFLWIRHYPFSLKQFNSLSLFVASTKFRVVVEITHIYYCVYIFCTDQNWSAVDL